MSAKDVGEGADSNVSKNMHFILSSGMCGEATAKKEHVSQEKITLRRNLGAIGERIDERF